MVKIEYAIFKKTYWDGRNDRQADRQKEIRLAVFKKCLDGTKDRQTDRQKDKVITVYPSSIPLPSGEGV
jgi:hypothetical protein